MTIAIVMMVIGAVLMLPMTVIAAVYILDALGKLFHDMFTSFYTYDILFSIAMCVLTLIGVALLWCGIVKLP